MHLVPVVELSGSLVLGIDEHLTVLIATVQALAVVVADSGPAQSQDLPLDVAFLAGVGAPQADLNRQIALVGDANVPPVLDRPALLDVNLRQDAHLCDDTDGVNRAHLLKVVDFLDCREAKAPILYGRIVVDLLDFRLLVEHD